MRLFTKEEDAYLREAWPTAPKEEISARLGRTYDSIKAHAQRMGLRREHHKRSSVWHDGANDEILRRLWLTHHPGFIADEIGVSRNAIIGRAYRLGLSKPRRSVRNFKKIIEAVFGAQPPRRRNGPAESTPGCPPVTGGPVHPIPQLVERRGNVFHFGPASLKTPPVFINSKETLTPQVSLDNLERHHCRAILALSTKIYNWNALGRRFGHHADTLRRKLDPTFVDDRKARGRRGKVKRLIRAEMDERPLTIEEFKARKALIPMDVRDFTARICGDPIPNDPRRSAVA
jgi:hypothetical protein